MVQLTLTNVDRAQKNKRNLDTMTLSDSDDERGDKEDRYEHDDEGSLYAESTGDATEAALLFWHFNADPRVFSKVTLVTHIDTFVPHLLR
jgi:hypothetical protein